MKSRLKRVLLFSHTTGYQLRAFNDAAGKHAEEVLLDDVGLVIFDAFEPVHDVEPIADFLRP